MTSTQGGTGAVSVVVPVFNSASTLPELVERVSAALQGREFELILVNDGSRDESWICIEGLAAAWPHVCGIDLRRNYGQHNALLAGIRAATYPLIVTIDDDLQNPPEEIEKVLRALEGSDDDVIYGTPIEAQHGRWRGTTSFVTKVALQGPMGSEAARNVSAFRAFRSPVRDAFDGYPGPFVSIDVLLTWGTSRFGSVPVRHEPRKAGRSNYTFRLLVNHALNMATGFSVRPLQLASVIGFAMALFGVAVLAYVIIRFIVAGGSVPGFPFLASIIAIFAGAQMFAIGIIGEYLARMHFRLMQKPTFVVRRTTPPDPLA